MDNFFISNDGLFFWGNIKNATKEEWYNGHRTLINGRALYTHSSKRSMYSIVDFFTLELCVYWE